MARRRKRRASRTTRGTQRTRSRPYRRTRRRAVDPNVWVWVALAVILVAGGVLRGLYLDEIAERPDFSNMLADARFNDYWARGLAFDDWTFDTDLNDPRVPTTPYFRAPGYPYFLGFVYRVTGPGHHASRVIQMCLGLVSVVLAFLFARRWYGTATGLVLAGLMSFYWIFPVLIPLLFLLLIIVSRWIERPRFAGGLAAGVVLGLAALLRQNVLLFVPAIGIWSLWLSRRRRPPRGVGVAFLGLLIGTSLAVLPATVRNYVVSKEFVPITTGAGVNLLIGNNPEATGFIMKSVPGHGDFKTAYDYPGIVERLEEKLGRELSYSEASGYLGSEAFRFIRENPGRALKLTGRKVLLFWGPREIPHSKSVQEARDGSGVLRRIPGSFPFVVALFVAGALLIFWEARARWAATKASRRRLEEEWPISVLVLLLILAWFASIVPFFIVARYRVPVTPLLLVFAAYALVRIVVFVASRDWEKAGIWTLVAVAFYVPASINFVEFEVDPATRHYELGFAYSRSGDLDKAIAEFERALEANPNHVHSHVDLGVTLLERGQREKRDTQLIERGLAHLIQAVRLNPDYPFAQYNLAVAYANIGRLDESIDHFEKTLALNPTFPGARDRLEMTRAVRDRALEERAP